MNFFKNIIPIQTHMNEIRANLKLKLISIPKIKNTYSELFFKIWLRNQIIYRILFKIKNFVNYQKEKRKNSSEKYKFIYQKLNFINFSEKFYSSCFFFLYEFYIYILIAKLFIFKLKKKKKFFQAFETKESFPFLQNKLSPFFLKNFYKNQNKTKINSLSIGKFIEIKGMIFQIKEFRQHIFAILLECLECKSLFYCFSDSLFRTKPFLCMKSNCKSKSFLSHQSKICSALWRKIRIKKKNSNNQEKHQSHLIDLEVIGERNSNLKLGQLIFLKGVLKIHNFNTKKKKNSCFFRNIFNFHILVQSVKIITSLKKNFLSKKFLTKSEYFFLNKLNRFSNLFNICVKSVNFFPNNQDGCKAAILIILGLKKRKKHPFICCFISGEKFSKKFNLISKISNISSDRFFFQQKQQKNFKNFLQKPLEKKNILKVFEKNYSNLFYQSKIFENEDSLVGWFESFKNSKFEKAEKKFFQNLIFIEIRLKKSFFNFKNTFLAEYFFEKKFYSLFDFFYFLPETVIKKRKFFNPVNIKEFFKKKKNKYFHKKSIEKKFFLKIIKKRLSSFILRRYINYTQICFSPCFSEEAKNLAVKYYLFFKKFQKKFYFSSFFFPLETIILFSETHAKIDFRKSITQNDVINAIEILSDSKPNDKKILENFILKKSSRIFKKLYFIKKFLKILKGLFFQKKRTLFSLKDLTEKFKMNTPFSIFEEIIEILLNYGLIKKIGKLFFQIVPF